MFNFKQILYKQAWADYRCEQNEMLRPADQENSNEPDIQTIPSSSSRSSTRTSTWSTSSKDSKDTLKSSENPASKYKSDQSNGEKNLRADQCVWKISTHAPKPRFGTNMILSEKEDEDCFYMFGGYCDPPDQDALTDENNNVVPKDPYFWKFCLRTHLWYVIDKTIENRNSPEINKSIGHPKLCHGQLTKISKTEHLCVGGARNDSVFMNNVGYTTDLAIFNMKLQEFRSISAVTEHKVLQHEDCSRVLSNYRDDKYEIRRQAFAFEQKRTNIALPNLIGHSCSLSHDGSCVYLYGGLISGTYNEYNFDLWKIHLRPGYQFMSLDAAVCEKYEIYPFVEAIDTRPTYGVNDNEYFGICSGIKRYRCGHSGVLFGKYLNIVGGGEYQGTSVSQGEERFYENREFVYYGDQKESIQKRMDKILSFDIETHGWVQRKTKPDKTRISSIVQNGYPERRMFHASVQDRQFLYIAGGESLDIDFQSHKHLDYHEVSGAKEQFAFTFKKYYSDCWRLDLDEMVWKYLSEIPIDSTLYEQFPGYRNEEMEFGLTKSSAIICKSKLILFGGHIKYRPVRTDYHPFGWVTTNAMYQIKVKVPSLKEICSDILNE